MNPYARRVVIVALMLLTNCPYYELF